MNKLGMKKKKTALRKYTKRKDKNLDANVRVRKIVQHSIVLHGDGALQEKIPMTLRFLNHEKDR